MATLNDRGVNSARYTFDALAASGTNSSEDLNVAEFLHGTFQFVWASHDDTSTAELQISLDDGSNYDTITGSSFTTTGVSGSSGLQIENLPGGLIRLSVTEADANAGATITAYFVGKKGR
jgi:hypothetical protein